MLAAGAFDFALEQAIVSPALPAVQARDHASPTAVTWLITGFLLSAAVATPLAGKLGDRYGRRRIVVLSLLAFAFGSVVCALAQSIGMLIAGRVIQGLGAGVGPLTLALACEGQAPEQVARAVGLLVGAAGAGAISGLFGALLIDHVGVASIFWLLVAVALCLALAVGRLVPESRARSREPIDWLGALLLAGGLAAIMLAVSQGSTWGWGSARVIGLEGGAAALLIAFVVRERGLSAPLVGLRTLAARPMWTANLAVFVVGFSFTVAYVLVPLISGYPKLTGYGLGLSATQIALVLVPAALAALAGGVLSGPLARSLGARNLAILGAACATATYLAFVAFHTTAAMIAVAMIPLGLGLGLSLSAISDLVVISSPAGETGLTIALNNVVRSIGSVLGPQVAVAIVTASPGLAPGLPAHRGFSHAFVMAAIASGATIMLIALIPGPRADPVLAAAAEPAA